MQSNLDPAIQRALQLPSGSQAVAASYSGSGFSSTWKITVSNNEDRHDTSKPAQYFAKTSKGSAARVMFAGEYASLNAIHTVVPSFCPAALGHGELEDDPGTYFLVTEWLERSSSSGSSGKGHSSMSLAAKLAKLHTTPAPVPEAHDKSMFGFSVTTCCGDTPQDNSFKASWPEFYAENRLLAILERSEKQNGRDSELKDLIERTAREVVPRLLGDGHLGGQQVIVPVVVHGDLWSGNRGQGRIGSQETVEEVVFDPSASYSHSEFELGIMQMFGGFGGSFLEEYHKLVPKTEPVEEYDDRIRLYELWVIVVFLDYADCE
ncbi:MAG: hypothetical protein GOMPHAMPRED_007445 [Gomphillus americanus]|uniref:protein-ribulosamine 3-kinase n=1 Tax=Gomphillus americanus TaxID=1940652 RepID=A0A8H3EZA3_9LECA|nr:MAG: hypothetical protein GOMPHAMPRED_007445 [Gomphillus americanus]